MKFVADIKKQITKTERKSKQITKRKKKVKLQIDIEKGNRLPKRKKKMDR